MAVKIAIENLLDEDEVSKLIYQAVRKGWMCVHIGQPVHWPEVNRFLDEANGFYLSVSRPEEPIPVNHQFWSTSRRYRQNFWFSDPNAAFDFKLRYG